MRNGGISLIRFVTTSKTMRRRLLDQLGRRRNQTQTKWSSTGKNRRHKGNIPPIIILILVG